MGILIKKIKTSAHFRSGHQPKALRHQFQSSERTDKKDRITLSSAQWWKRQFQKFQSSSHRSGRNSADW